MGMRFYAEEIELKFLQARLLLISIALTDPIHALCCATSPNWVEIGC